MKKILLFSVFLISISSQAATITFDSTDNGWYNNLGEHNKDNTNVHTGYCPEDCFRETDTNSFFNFNVSTLSGKKIHSASIKFQNDNGFFISDTGTETIAFYDVLSVPGESSSSNALSIYFDLMSGVKYGEYTLSQKNYWIPEFSVNLDPLSFDDILADNLFSIGATLTTLVKNGINQGFWASSSGTPAAQLIVEYSEITPPDQNPVPAPATLWLFLLALICMKKAQPLRIVTTTGQ